MICLNTVKIIKKQQEACGGELNSSTDHDNITRSILNSESFNYKANFISSVTNNNLTKMMLKLLFH